MHSTFSLDECRTMECVGNLDVWLWKEFSDFSKVHAVAWVTLIHPSARRSEAALCLFPAKNTMKTCKCEWKHVSTLLAARSSWPSSDCGHIYSSFSGSASISFHSFLLEVFPKRIWIKPTSSEINFFDESLSTLQTYLILKSKCILWGNEHPMKYLKITYTKVPVHYTTI